MFPDFESSCLIGGRSIVVAVQVEKGPGHDGGCSFVAVEERVSSGDTVSVAGGQRGDIGGRVAVGN